jgi:hypothetical protein
MSAAAWLPTLGLPTAAALLAALLLPAPPAAAAAAAAAMCLLCVGLRTRDWGCGINRNAGVQQGYSRGTAVGMRSHGIMHSCSTGTRDTASHPPAACKLFWLVRNYTMSTHMSHVTSGQATSQHPPPARGPQLTATSGCKSIAHFPTTLRQNRPMLLPTHPAGPLLLRWWPSQAQDLAVLVAKGAPGPSPRLCCGAVAACCCCCCLTEAAPVVWQTAAAGAFVVGLILVHIFLRMVGLGGRGHGVYGTGLSIRV